MYIFVEQKRAPTEFARGRKVRLKNVCKRVKLKEHE